MVLFNAGRAPILCPQGRDRHRPKAGTVTMCSITAPAWGPHGAPGRGSAWSSPPGARGAPPGSGRDPGSRRQHSWEHRCRCCSSAPRVRLSSHPCSHCSAPLLSVPRQNRSCGAMVTGGGGVGGPSSLLAAFPRGVVLFCFGVSLDAWALRPTQVGKCALFVWEWQTCLTARSSETAPSAAPRRAHSGRLSASVPTAQRSALPSAHSPHCEPLQPSSPPPPPPPAAPGLP